MKLIKSYKKAHFSIKGLKGILGHKNGRSYARFFGRKFKNIKNTFGSKLGRFKGNFSINRYGD